MGTGEMVGLIIMSLFTLSSAFFAFYRIAKGIGDSADNFGFGAIMLMIFIVPLWFNLSGELKERQKIIREAEITKKLESGDITVDIKRLSKLKKDLKKKKEEIKSTMSDFYFSSLNIQKQVVSRAEKLGLNSLQSAMQDSQTRHNLELIQRKKAYIIKLTAVDKRLELGIEKILFLERQLIDDMKLVKIVKGKDLKKISKRISVVLEEYNNKKNEPFLVETLEIPSLELVWSEIQK